MCQHKNNKFSKKIFFAENVFIRAAFTTVLVSFLYSKFNLGFIDNRQNQKFSYPQLLWITLLMKV